VESGRVKLLHEENLLGTAGTLKKLYKDSPDDILAVHVDNFSSLKLETFVKFFQSHTWPYSCIALFETVNFTNSGMMEFDKDSIVTSYLHKPQFSNSRFANAGVFLFTKDDLEELFQSNERLIDISQDVIPLLLGRMKGYQIEGIHLDIGTDLDTYQNIDTAIALSGYQK
jgi:NDP-sugar pyrophosphorylase family protein